MRKETKVHVKWDDLKIPLCTQQQKCKGLC